MTTEETIPLVVVTGITGGIGKATCLTLAKEGYSLVGQYNKNEEQAKRTQDECRSLGCNFTVVSADFTTPEGVEMVTEVAEHVLEESNSHLHGLVNNAGKMLGPGIETAKPVQFDEYMAVNLRAPFFLMQQLSRLMKPGGSIVNISSIGAHFSSSGDIVYAISKAALEALVFHSAEALGKRGVRVNSVIPGFTDNGHELFTNPTVREYMSNFSALGGIAAPHEVADAIAFLLSARASRITGSALDVSGGSALGVRRQAESLSLRDLAQQSENT